jgi:hypothetical protein
MPDDICDGCGQPLLTRPTRCAVCRNPITPHQAFTHARAKGVCTPAHRDCNESKQGALL